MIPIAELERFLGVDSGTDLALLLELEAEAVEWFEGVTKRYFGATSADTRYLTGSSSRLLYLPEPIDEVTSVHEQLYPGDDQTEIVEGADDGFVIRDRHLVRKGGYLWKWGYEYVVVYTRGYEETATAVEDVTPADIAVPDDVRNAVKGIVGYWYAGGKRDAATAGLVSETMGDYSYSRGATYQAKEAMLNAVPGLRQTVENYRAWIVS